MDNKYIEETRALQRCRKIAQKLLEEYQWRLLSTGTLAHLICKEESCASSDEVLARQAMHAYTQVLYKACRQSDDPARRELAYRDLHHYLYRAACNRWPELAEDATQRALVLICEQIDRCREPGTFLAFALWKLRHAFQQEKRARRILQDDEALAIEVGQSRLTQANPIPVRKQLLHEEQITMLTEALQSLRDPRKRQAITLKYFADLDDTEISRQLGISVSYVRVLRHRGIEKLRENERLRRYFDISKEEDV